MTFIMLAELWTETETASLHVRFLTVNILYVYLCANDNLLFVPGCITKMWSLPGAIAAALSLYDSALIDVVHDNAVCTVTDIVCSLSVFPHCGWRNGRLVGG